MNELLVPSIGVTVVVNRSSLSEALKAHLPGGLVSFLDCPLCVGFWAGLVVSCGSLPVREALLCGFSSSILSYLVVSVTDAIRSYTSRG